MKRNKCSKEHYLITRVEELQPIKLVVSPTTKEVKKMNNLLLPNGKTCKDCVGFKMCVSFFDDLENSSTCKWTPNEFQINKKRKIGSNKLANNKKIKGQYV